MKQSDLELIKEDVGKLLTEMNIIVTEVSYEVEGKYKFLRIELDKASGLDLNTIVEATHIINPQIDKYKFLNDSYILDVISKEKGEITNG